jgi:methionine-rich copper-binding protein CopC
MARTTASIRAAIGALALATALTVAPTAAHAHDELIGSTPSAGERLAEAPASVELRFSGEVMTLGAAVVVADADGHDWVAEQPEIGLDGLVTVMLQPDMPDAGYEIRWRVISADGHPISGIVPFTIGDAEPLEREPASGASGKASTGDTDESGDTASADDQITQDGGLPRVAVIGAGGAAAGAAVFALALFITRRRSTRSAGTDTTGAHTEPGVDDNEGTL